MAYATQSNLSNLSPRPKLNGKGSLSIVGNNKMAAAVFGVQVFGRKGTSSSPTMPKPYNTSSQGGLSISALSFDNERQGFKMRRIRCNSKQLMPVMPVI